MDREKPKDATIVKSNSWNAPDHAEKVKVQGEGFQDGGFATIWVNDIAYTPEQIVAATNLVTTIERVINQTTDEYAACDLREALNSISTQPATPHVNVPDDGTMQNYEKTLAAIKAAGLILNPVADGGGKWHYELAETVHGEIARLKAELIKKDSDVAWLKRERLFSEIGWKFFLGQRVTKIKGSSWTGHIVGFYSTKLTPRGYNVESENEPGSVQLYPEAALKEI